MIEGVDDPLDKVVVDYLPRKIFYRFGLCMGLERVEVELLDLGVAEIEFGRVLTSASEVCPPNMDASR